MHTADRERMLNWAALGLWQGCKWGLVFGLLVTGGVLGLITVGDPVERLLWSLFMAVVSLFAYVVPAVGGGAIVGGLTGAVVSLPSLYKSLRLRRTVALGITLPIAVVHILTMAVRGMGYYDTIWDRLSVLWLYPGMTYLAALIMIFWISSRIPTLTLPFVSVETALKEQEV